MTTALIQRFIIKKANWEPSEAMLVKVKGVRRAYNKQHMIVVH